MGMNGDTDHLRQAQLYQGLVRAYLFQGPTAIEKQLEFHCTSQFH